MAPVPAEFGVFLPPERIANVIPVQGFEFFQRTAQACEKLGYKVVFSADHWMEVVSSVMYECWTLLGALAAVTSKIRLGSAVTPIPLYHPPSLAKRVATVDHISGGRATLGAGCGWYEEEFKAYGVEFGPLRTRVEKMMEGLEIMTRLWSQEEPVTYHGRFCTVENAICLPKPIQKPRIPIWFGGASRSMLEAVGKYGDGWIPFGLTPEDYRQRLEMIRKYADRSGRNPDSITPGLAIRVIIGKSSGRIEDVLRKLRIPTDTGTDKQTGLDREGLAKYGVNMERGVSDFDLITFVGTPEEIVSSLRKYSDAGVKFFRCGILDEEKYVEDAELFANEVMPYFT